VPEQGSPDHLRQASQQRAKGPRPGLRSEGFEVAGHPPAPSRRLRGLGRAARAEKWYSRSAPASAGARSCRGIRSLEIQPSEESSSGGGISVIEIRPQLPIRTGFLHGTSRSASWLCIPNRRTWQRWTPPPPKWSLTMVLFLPSKSETSHRRKEAALKEWLEDDTKSPRRNGGAMSGRFWFVRM
jgi:hypothetical protein